MVNGTEGDREVRCSCAKIAGIHTMGSHDTAERCVRCGVAMKPFVPYVAYGRVFRKPAHRLCPECLRTIKTRRA